MLFFFTRHTSVSYTHLDVYKRQTQVFTDSLNPAPLEALATRLQGCPYRADVLQQACEALIAVSYTHLDVYKRQGWILELDRGEGIPWEGNYSSWLEQKYQRLAQEASQEAARRKSIEKELEWVRQGAKGRQSKGCLLYTSRCV